MNEDPKPCPRFQLHLSTCVVLMVVAGMLTPSGSLTDRPVRTNRAELVSGCSCADSREAPGRYRELYGEEYLLSPYMRVQLSRVHTKQRRPGAAKYKPRESKTEIRLGLLSLARQLGWPGREVTIPELRREDPSLIDQADNAFGSMTKVKEACGFKVRYRRRYTSKETVAEALRRCVKANGSLAVTFLMRQDPALSAAVDRKFGSLAMAARVLGLPYKPRYEAWSAKRVLKVIRRRFRKGLPLNPTAVLESDGRLYVAAVRRFGSWKAALEASRLDYFRVVNQADRSPEALVRDLVEWVRKHGPLNYAALRLSDVALCSAAESRFGGIEKAARAFGLPYAPRMTRWDKALVLRKIRERRKAGLPLNSGALKGKGNAALLRAGMLLFGSWDKALESAGVEAKAVRKRFERDIDSTARELRAWVKRHGPLNHTALKESDSRLVASVIGWKGTVEAAANALGLPYRTRKVNWTKALVLERIRQRRASGLALNVLAVQKNESGLFAAGRILFGSWDKALADAGLDPAKVRKQLHHDPAELARDLRAWVKRHGPLNYTALNRSDSRLCSAVLSREGSLEVAARKLRLPYKARVENWGEDVVRCKIRELRAVGEAVNAKAIQDLGTGLHAAGLRYFGSWDNALKASGVDPAKVRLR